MLFAKSHGCQYIQQGYRLDNKPVQGTLFPSGRCIPTDVRAVASPRGGGKWGNLLPQPPIGHPVRSMQIRGDFRVRKNGVGFQDLLRSFTCTDATADVLWSYDYEKEGVVEVVEGVRYSGRPSVKLRGPLGSFSPGIGPPRYL